MIKQSFFFIFSLIHRQFDSFSLKIFQLDLVAISVVFPVWILFDEWNIGWFFFIQFFFTDLIDDVFRFFFNELKSSFWAAVVYYFSGYLDFVFNSISKNENGIGIDSVKEWRKWCQKLGLFEGFKLQSAKELTSFH